MQLDVDVADWRLRATRLEHDTAELSRRLDRAGIDHRILDGPVIAHRAYRDPSQRLYATVDVLVADGRAAAHELDDLASGRRMRLITELHPNRFGLPVGVADLPSPADTVVVAGQPLPTLPVDAQAVVACVGAVDAEGRGRLAERRDIVELALAGGATLDGVVHWASEWRVTSSVARAIRLSWETFDLADKIGLSSWALRYESAAPPRRAVNGRTGAAHRLASRFRLGEPGRQVTAGGAPGRARRRARLSGRASLRPSGAAAARPT